jgi:NADH-quinone oxidoreductase subunit J
VNLAIFYASSAVAIATTVMVILSRNPVYAVLYLILSLFGISLVFYTLGAPFIALLEIIVYAGAIMVLFLFVVMMLNLGRDRTEADLQRPSRKQLILPGGFALILLIEIVAVLVRGGAAPAAGVVQSPQELGRALYGTHFLGVELASLILLIGIIGGMRLGKAAAADEALRSEAAANAAR